MAGDVYLNVVDEQDNVIGQELRSEIHKRGLRHREVHVWFFTSDGSLIFQRRSATKETYPNYLDATAGGHVELNQSYEEAALAEVSEETGFALQMEDLIPLAKITLVNDDKERGLVNNVFRMIYAYPFRDSAQSLKIEDDEGAGFEVLSLTEAMGGQSEMAKQIVPGIFKDGYLPAWDAFEKAFS